MAEEVVDEIWTSKEAAEYFKTTVASLEQLARRGEVPAKKVGRHWRFSAAALKRWFSDWKPNTFNPNKKAGEILEQLRHDTKKTRI